MIDNELQVDDEVQVDDEKLFDEVQGRSSVCNRDTWQEKLDFKVKFPANSNHLGSKCWALEWGTETI